jgi:hypothetical protein
VCWGYTAARLPCLLRKLLIIPFGPKDVRVICDRALQASMFFMTASSTPLKCLCPSFNMA